ncbi:MAG: YDG domain-containing protein [Pilosibacter sp.]
MLIIVDHRFLEHGASVRIRKECPLHPFIRRYGTTAYQVEFIPDKASEGQYGEPLTQSVIPEISPKKLQAVLTTPIEKPYDGNTDIALEATVKIGTPGQSSGQSYNISGLKGRFEDANAGTGKTVTIDSSKAVIGYR